MIPTYNDDGFLAATLSSVMAQYDESMQVEVVDDHSTVGDAQGIVQAVGGGRVSFFRQPRNVGHTRNFNTCLQRSRGDYVHLLHGDDVVEPGFYEVMGRHLDTVPEVGSAICRHAIIDASGVRQSVGPLLRQTAGILEEWLATIASGQLVQPPGVVVRRSVYESIGGFNEAIQRYGEDWEMWVRIAAATDVLYEPSVLAGYRKRASGSLSDPSRVRANMSDMRLVLDSNRRTLTDARVPRSAAIDAAARRSLSRALIRRATRTGRDAGVDGSAPMLIEALRFDPSIQTAARSALAVGRTLAQSLPRPVASRSWPPRQEREASPIAVLDAAPREVAEAIRGAAARPLPPSPPPKHHLLYAIDDRWVLHLYGSPATRITRSLPDRRLIDALSLPGIPGLEVAATTEDGVWVLEQRLPGVPPDVRAPDDWVPRVLDFLVSIAGPPGPQLGTTEFWAEHVAPAVEEAPVSQRVAIRQAWDRIADLPSRVVHGDVQPKNLLLGRDVGLIDWEGAWRHGLPGLDLVFLALMRHGSGPDPIVIQSLSSDVDAPHVPLLPALAAVGVPAELRRPTLLAALSVFNLGEARRIARAEGFRHHQTPFRALLDLHGASLGGPSGER